MGAEGGRRPGDKGDNIEDRGGSSEQRKTGFSGYRPACTGTGKTPYKCLYQQQAKQEQSSRPRK